VSDGHRSAIALQASQVLVAMNRFLVAIALSAVIACSGGRGDAIDSRWQEAGGDDIADTADVADAAGPWRWGEEWSLLPWVRLDSTRARPNGVFPWPREAEDAIAVVRDDWPGLSWKAPAGDSFVELDLLPIFRRALPLATLTLGYENGEPDAATAILLPDCTRDDSEGLSLAVTGIPLDLADAEAGCLRLRFQSEGTFDLATLDLTSRAAGAQPPALDLVAGPREPAKLLPFSGVVEGFYGIPWSWAERERMIALQGNVGMGTYLFAPKDDPYHRDQWREPYPDEMVARFDSLNDFAAVREVTLFMGISPFIDWGPDEEADYETLLQKLQAFQAVGIRGFALLADDIEFDIVVSVDGPLGAKHVAVANQLLADLRAEDPEAQLWFVPTVYSDERLEEWSGGADYLAECAKLHPDIEVMWTGPGTSNTTLAGSDFDTVEGLLGRPVVLWENHWANDGGDLFTGRVLLAPYAEREPAVADRLRGIVVNPSIQGSLSKVAVSTVAAYLHGPDTYTPGDGVLAAGLLTAESTEYKAGIGEAVLLVAQLMETFDGHAHLPPGHREFEAGMAALVEALETDGDVSAAAQNLLPVVLRLATLERRVYHSLLPGDTVDELRYPFGKVDAEARVALHALGFISDRLAGKAGTAHKQAAQAAQEESATSRFEFSTGQADALLAAALKLPVASPGTSAPTGTEGPPPACQTGQPWQWSPYPDCPSLLVEGLPEALADGDIVTWVPPHPGRWAVGVGCVAGKSFAGRLETVSCR
jgi:hypothetical protein